MIGGRRRQKQTKKNRETREGALIFGAKMHACWLQSIVYFLVFKAFPHQNIKEHGSIS